MIADKGSVNAEIFSGNKSFPSTIDNEAPSAAPADTPIRLGSASGFLNNPCSEAPDIDNADPTKQASNTRGNLNLNNTVLSISSISLYIISIIDISKLPNEIANINERNSIVENDIIMSICLVLN